MLFVPCAVRRSGRNRAGQRLEKARQVNGRDAAFDRAVEMRHAATGKLRRLLAVCLPHGTNEPQRHLLIYTFIPTLYEQKKMRTVILVELSYVRDDLAVPTAIVQRMDGTLSGLVNEIRATHTHAAGTIQPEVVQAGGGTNGMTINIEKLREDIRWETRKFVLQAILAIAAAAGAGVAIGNLIWAHGPQAPAQVSVPAAQGGSMSGFFGMEPGAKPSER